MDSSSASSNSNQEMIIPHLLPLEKNRETINKDIFTNLVKMLIERGLINKERQDEIIGKLASSMLIDLIFKIKLDNYKHIYGENNDTMIIKIVNHKITSLSKSSGFHDILTTYNTFPKILIVQDISLKTRYQIKTDKSYNFLEIFLEKELLINIIDHVSQPKFTLLSEEEATLVLQAYHANRRDLPKMSVMDAIARYYNASHGQLMRIIRPSETSGLAVSYRLIINSLI